MEQQVPIKQNKFINNFTQDIINTCLEYATDNQTKDRIHNIIIAPTLSYIIECLYPYLFAFSILFVINIILLISLIYIVIQMRKDN